MTNLKVTNLIQNNYIYRYKKTTRYKNKNLVITMVMFILCISVVYGLKISTSYADDIISTISYIQNPIDSLYSDIGDIVFTSAGEKIILKKDLDFVSPIIYGNCSALDNCIEFDVASPVICSMEKGVVSDIYIIGNNVKCVKIKHNRNVYSVIENVDVLGVNIGAIVEKGQKLGTANIGEKLRAYIEEFGEYKSLSINGKNICIN